MRVHKTLVCPCCVASAMILHVANDLLCSEKFLRIALMDPAFLRLLLGERRNSLMQWQTLVSSFGLIALSFAPMLLEKAGLFYTTGALFFNIGFSCYGAQLAMHKTNAAARRLLLASIVCLPVVFVLIVLCAR